MTYATEILSAPVGIADRLALRFADWKDKMAQRAQYRETVRELSALSDRELNDLGLGRASIRTVARMAVYGN
ncbi:hypothetical protein GCM10016455_11510 [Aliiroseovarius zhejiangensis]|uniref:YjiS-like domain-containing protein n=1 Tax=Aliiroseovarius zhejiangensis TaxID=1632025 RepID=A0ABQ3IT61_9RHOB|nr:DUF1127 domain-containing protein [Aliiroseovarius zhejiangensis]GHE93053.1 hypothetical protein GCM10016455_11510 [Aliiroseovarius zhejiangensis]